MRQKVAKDKFEHTGRSPKMHCQGDWNLFQVIGYPLKGVKWDRCVFHTDESNFSIKDGFGGQQLEWEQGDQGKDDKNLKIYKMTARSLLVNSFSIAALEIAPKLSD